MVSVPESFFPIGSVQLDYQKTEPGLVFDNPA